MNANPSMKASPATVAARLSNLDAALADAGAAGAELPQETRASLVATVEEAMATRFVVAEGDDVLAARLNEAAQPHHTQALAIARTLAVHDGRTNANPFEHDQLKRAYDSEFRFNQRFAQGYSRSQSTPPAPEGDRATTPPLQALINERERLSQAADAAAPVYAASGGKVGHEEFTAVEDFDAQAMGGPTGKLYSEWRQLASKLGQQQFARNVPQVSPVAWDALAEAQAQANLDAFMDRHGVKHPPEVRARQFLENVRAGDVERAAAGDAELVKAFAQTAALEKFAESRLPSPHAREAFMQQQHSRIAKDLSSGRPLPEIRVREHCHTQASQLDQAERE